MNVPKISVLVLVAVLGGVALPATAHNPVPGPNFAGCGTLPYAPLPTFNIMVLGGPVTYPAPGTYNFCAYMDTIYCSLSLVATLLDEIAQFANLVQCISADINGPLNPEAEIPMTPNGMLDGQYELGIVAAVMNNTAHPLHSATMAAFQVNFKVIKDMVVEALSVANLKNDDKDLRGLVNALAPHLTGALSGVLAAFAVMGDAQTNAALDELIGLLADIGLTPPPGGIAAITSSVPQLGPYGDADGDSYTNYAEYLYFVNELGYTAPQYVAAALDAGQSPGPPVLPDPEVRLIGRRYHPVGAYITLKTKLYNFVYPPAYFRWYRYGVLLPDVTGHELVIADAQPADSGIYQVFVGAEVDLPEGNKNTEIVEVSAWFSIEVGEHQLPAASGFTLGVAALACALAGVRSLRRRNSATKID